MVFFLIFRFWLALAARVYAFFQAWMPTKHLVRWINSDRGIRWGTPIGAALSPLYFLAMTWSGEHLTAGGSAWWWAPTLWAALNAIKFAHVTMRSPFVWGYRVVRRRTARRVDAYRQRPATERAGSPVVDYDAAGPARTPTC